MSAAGMFALSLGEEYENAAGRKTRLKYQGLVKRVEDAAAAVQLFSAWDGAPTNVILVPIADLMDQDQWIQYDSKDAWHRAYIRMLGTREDRIEDCVEAEMKRGSA